MPFDGRSIGTARAWRLAAESLAATQLSNPIKPPPSFFLIWSQSRPAGGRMHSGGAGFFSWFFI